MGAGKNVRIALVTPSMSLKASTKAISMGKAKHRRCRLLLCSSGSQYPKHEIVIIFTDIFITHLNEQDSDEIKRKFKQCGADNVHLITVENKGRDVAPFIDVLKPYIEANTYEVIGHFHSKKSLEVGGDLGDRWRRFLLNTLIGPEKQASQIMAQFNDPKVGLVFAEDRHTVDSGNNKKFISDLYNKMEIDADVNCYLFPLGTMFWARSEAIKPLFSLPQALYTPDEPLPYDGSYLHAIERVIPAVAQAQGFSFLTLNQKNINW